MENTTYGPSPIPQHPAAALVAFSQANSLSEALRLRQFPQGTDGKDLSNPFSAASLLRPSEAAVAAAAGLAAHHHGLAWPLFNLQHPFFHPSLDPRFGPGAFRPLGPAGGGGGGGDDPLKPFHPFGAALGQPPQQQQQQPSPVHHHQQQQKGLIVGSGGGGGGTGSTAAAAAAAVVNSGGGGGKLAEGLQAFNLSRYNPLFGSLGSVESSLAAGRLVFNGGSNSQQQQQQHQLRVIQGQPESPNNNNNNNAAIVSASPPGSIATSIIMAPGAADSSSDAHRDAAATPSSDAGTDPRSTPDDVRSSRRRKKSPLDPSCCPVCGITLRSADLEAHFVQELERLERVSRSFRSTAANHHHHHHHHHHHSPSPSSGMSAAAAGALAPTPPGATSQIQKREQDTRWETFHRIRINRANRIRAKGRKRRADERDDTPERGGASSSGTPCPVCGERLHGTPDELNQHVVRCLRRQNGEDAEDDEPLDVEGDSYEEYEWAGQRRIRATTMLEGGFAAVGMQICKAGDEENEDVVVDGDDTAAFGPSQFTENDIQTAAAEQCSPADDANVKTEAKEFAPLTFKETDSKDHIINALKSRVNDLEEMNKEAKQKNRCLICLGDYRKPVVSTSCWHVHCEECWLQALGNKKLCPQCNLITSPTHLRRIYM